MNNHIGDGMGGIEVGFYLIVNLIIGAKENRNDELNESLSLCVSISTELPSAILTLSIVSLSPQ
jgi:hypothetical protein